ncbi:hypothetical protein GCM10028803_44640 [Larkinella knui]|uniref:Sigma-70 family RNA polymerase sigma factor n=1 Tax=Larkinella knui TaxID=2025310 RepID=A0A3P1CP29_9BACT|nr:sigma-70 family RNA polymerase sigma factor [Larkinella knui]RRB15073.1 sigma-70 family RNA polymerase sigma factor [Larkinella knui]
MDSNAPMFYEMIRSDQKTREEAYRYYRSACLKFCESLIKDKAEAERMVRAVFSEIHDTESGLNPDQDFEKHLFICLRNTVFTYLKATNTCQLIQQQALQNEKTNSNQRKIRGQFIHSLMNTLIRKR